MAESCEGAYDYGFSQCRNLIKKLYLKVDITNDIQKVAIEMGMKRDLESSSKATKGSVKELGQPTTEVNATEAIAMKPKSVVPPAKTEDLEAGRKSDPAPAIEPAIADTSRDILT